MKGVQRFFLQIKNPILLLTSDIIIILHDRKGDSFSITFSRLEHINIAEQNVTASSNDVPGEGNIINIIPNQYTAWKGSIQVEMSDKVILYDLPSKGRCASWSYNPWKSK